MLTSNKSVSRATQYDSNTKGVVLSIKFESPNLTFNAGQESTNFIYILLLVPTLFSRLFNMFLNLLDSTETCPRKLYTTKITNAASNDNIIKKSWSIKGIEVDLDESFNKENVVVASKIPDEIKVPIKITGMQLLNRSNRI